MKYNDQDPRLTPLGLYLWFMAQETLAHKAMGQGRTPRQPVNLNDADVEWLRGVGIKL